MSRKTARYSEVRGQMLPGDVIAFGGHTAVSKLTKLLTMSNVSHVGVIMQTRVRDDQRGDFYNAIIESTQRDERLGVIRSRCSAVVESYPGEVWWLPLRRRVRERFDEQAFFDFLLKAEGAAFDAPQALGAMLDGLDDLFGRAKGPTCNREELVKFYCAELVAAALERAGTVGSINASEVSPIDLCRWHIYKKSYFQLRGEELSISRYNTLDPALWRMDPKDA